MVEKQSINDFLLSYPNKSTRNAYQSSLLNFGEQIVGIKKREGRRIKDEELKVFDKAMLAYLNNGKTQEDYFNDVKKFAVWLNCKPPKTAQLSITAIKEFFLTNGIEFSQIQQKLIRRALPKGGPLTVENELDVDTFKSILEHCDIRGKALFMALKGSGMRIDECLQIRLDDLIIQSIPARTTLRAEYTKTKKQRLVLFDQEATNEIKEWLKVRDNYLKAAVNKNKGLVNAGRAKGKNLDDKRLFPFTVSVANQMWNNAVSKAGLMEKDKGTGRMKLHIHQTRKFFLSQLKLSCPPEIAEGLAGHSGGYLEDAYRRHPQQQVIDYFLKHQRQLYLYLPKEDIEKLENEFNIKHDKLETEFEAKNSATKDMITKFAVDNYTLQQKFEKQLKEKEEQIKNLTMMHDSLQLTMEATIEKTVRERMDTYRKTMETPLDKSEIMEMINQTNADFLAHLDRIEKEKDTLKQELEELKAKKNSGIKGKTPCI
jgi:integrase